jgi:ATP-grasp domain
MNQARNVVFVAPFFQETTLRLLNAAVRLPGVRVGLVSQDPESRVPPELRALLAGHYRVDRCLETEGIAPGVDAMRRVFGTVDRLLGALEELQVPLGELRDAMGIPGMGAGAAQNFRDKSRMKTVLQDANLPCARHVLARSVEEARVFAAQAGFPLVAKPPTGSGARSTFRLEATEQLEECLAAMPPSSDRPTLLEEFVSGEEHSFDSVSLGGRVVWSSISHYAPSPLEVLREPWIQWCVMIPREVQRPEYTAIQEAAARALPALGLDTGLSHMEWFRRPDGRVVISEVGARPPGAQFTKLISYAHDFDLYAAWAQLMVFDTFQPRPRPFACGAAYLRGQGQGKVQAVTGLDRLDADIRELVVEHRLPAVGQAATGSYEGEGYIIVRHPETAVVEEALARIVSRVRVELG